MNNHSPVLIVGAGPTGLVMACELARRGIAFRIIDKNQERTQTSNATWVQPRTLEILNAMGIVDRFTILGNICRAITLHLDGKELLKIPFAYADSTFPFILILPQSELERLLIEHLRELNVTIERDMELINLQESNTVVCTLKNSNGKEEILEAEYVIGCDGVRSTVREKCGLSFLGEDIPDQFMVADAKMGSYLSKDEIHVFFDNGALFAASSLSSDLYRITANLHLAHARKTFTEKEVKEMATERSHGAYNVHAVSWIYPFWIHGKMAEKMRLNSVFLAGDAAHSHSPVGGEGMNTGIQDAYNLAWKLALVLQNKAIPHLLESYHAERYPAIKEVVEQTESFTKMALSDKEFNSKLLHFSSKLIANQAEVSKKLTSTLGQLNVQYKNSPVIDYNEDFSAKAPRYGDLAPDVLLTKSTRLYDLFRNGEHNILVFSGEESEQDVFVTMKAFQQQLAQTFPDGVSVHIVTNEEMSDATSHILLDKDMRIHKRYQVKEPAIYVIRPDNYIAFCSKNLDPALTENFLRRYLRSV